MPAIVEAMQLSVEILKMDARKHSRLLSVIKKLVDASSIESIALIGYNNIIQGLVFRDSKPVAESNIVKNIGKECDFQCFVSYLDGLDPRITENLNRVFIRDAVTQKFKKIRMTVELENDFQNVSWDWLDEAETMLFGNWVKEQIFEATKLFETITYLTGGKSFRTRKSIILSERGELEVEAFKEEVANSLGTSYPMIFPPKPWGYDLVEPGGYWLPQPGDRSSLVHDSEGTLPSHRAIYSLNRVQAVPWRVNTYILNILHEIQNRCIEVGSFRTFIEDLYNARNPLITNPLYANLPWNADANLTDEQKRQRNYEYALRKLYERNKTEKRHQAVNPSRVVAMADMFRTVDKFWIPWFMDTRTRMYSVVDTLNPQGGDYQRALLCLANGTEKSIVAQYDALVSIATTYGNGVDKKNFDARATWAYQNVQGTDSFFYKLSKDPMAPHFMEFWIGADEPLQFLALLDEYVKVYIDGIQDTHHVISGRDATCSGIQITGAILRDTQTCKLVNVLPSPEPQDAYGAVAREARKLLNNNEWVAEMITKREENREKQTERAIKKFNKQFAEGNAREKDRPEPYVYRGMDEFQLSRKMLIDMLDRSKAKMVVMLTPYGGTYKTMLRHVTDKYTDAFIKKFGGGDAAKDQAKQEMKLVRPDMVLITHALVQGMATALRAFSEVNNWFQSLAKAALDRTDYEDGEERTISWETPVGSLVVQEYKTDVTGTTRTFLGDYASQRYFETYRKLNHREKFNTDTKSMRTALAANVVHSLDASIIQDAVARLPTDTLNFLIEKIDEKILPETPFEETLPFTVVHDCFYAPAGGLNVLHGAIRQAFKFVVSANTLESIAENNLPNEEHRALLPKLTKGRANIDQVLASEYLFS